MTIWPEYLYYIGVYSWPPSSMGSWLSHCLHPPLYATGMNLSWSGHDKWGTGSVLRIRYDQCFEMQRESSKERGDKDGEGTVGELRKRGREGTTTE